MLRLGLLVGLFLSLSGVNSPLGAAEPVESIEVRRLAIERAIPLIEAGMHESAEQRQCFTCHSQAVPVIALAEIRQHGFAVNVENFNRQLQHTRSHLDRGKQAYQEGKGQGGKVLTAGYALWTLEAGQQSRSETTDAVTAFLLQHQSSTSHWKHSGNRPPSSGSDFTATYLALRGLATFGTAKQQEEIAKRREQVGQWVLSTKPRDTEDHVFRLLTLPYVSASDEVIQQAVTDLTATQRDDGSWSQLPTMEGDAYATATALVALQRVGKLSADDPVVHRGMNYLLKTQLDDGSWHVVTRAKPIQTYFESGFPHDEDQFISITASAWSALALTLTLPSKAE